MKVHISFYLTDIRCLWACSFFSGCLLQDQSHKYSWAYVQTEEINGYIRENWILKQHVDFQTWLCVGTQITTRKLRVSGGRGSNKSRVNKSSVFTSRKRQYSVTIVQPSHTFEGSISHSDSHTCTIDSVISSQSHIKFDSFICKMPPLENDDVTCFHAPIDQCHKQIWWQLWVFCLCCH